MWKSGKYSIIFKSSVTIKEKKNAITDYTKILTEKHKQGKFNIINIWRT